MGCLLRNIILTSMELVLRISSINDAHCSSIFPGALSEGAVISTGLGTYGLSTQWYGDCDNDDTIMLQTIVD